MQIFFPESQKNDTTEKIESSRTNGLIIKNKLNTTVVVLIYANFFPESQKNDTTEKIESSKRTNGFIIKNKLNTTVVVLIYANFLPRISEK